jgi:CDP-diacylglycerol--serine O-phosphatidyltransferase
VIADGVSRPPHGPRPPRSPQLARRLRRGAYLLPSLFTIGNIFMGFYAIVLGMRAVGLVADDLPPGSHRFGFDFAALLIFAAGIFDALDGRIARMVGTESDFGKEYDSLADVFTFGVAPALLTFLWGLSEWGRVGWLVPFFFLVCTATRLARFNVQTKVVDTRFFVGLPTPAAAGTICSMLFFMPILDLDSKWRIWAQLFMLVALLLLGALMVSTFRYNSFKKIDLRQRWSYRTFVPIAAVLLVIAFQPRATFLAISLLYASSGPASSLFSRLRRPKRELPPEPA